MPEGARTLARDKGHGEGGQPAAPCRRCATPLFTAPRAPPHLLQEVQRQVDVLGLLELRVRGQARLARTLAARQVDKVQLGAADQGLPRPPRLQVQREDAVGARGGLVQGRLCHHPVGVTQEELREWEGALGQLVGRAEWRHRTGSGTG